MKSKFIINLVLVLTVFALLAVFACYIQVRVIPDSVAVLRTSGMMCGSCESEIHKVLEQQRGVASAEVSAASGEVTVWYDSHAVQPELLIGKLTGSGYPSSLLVTMRVEKFMAITGKTGGSRQSAKDSRSNGCCVK